MCVFAFVTEREHEAATANTQSQLGQATPGLQFLFSPVVGDFLDEIH